jgi:AmiR/NasT family two-component response regulator
VTSVLLFRTPAEGAPDLPADFAGAGCTVFAEADGARLVQRVTETAADLVACWVPSPDEAWWQQLLVLQERRPVSLLVFTDDDSVQSLERALQVGVHAWVVRGYAPERLRALAQLAIARARHERALRERLADLDEKLQERKWVDRAKGILMRAQHVGEEEAFQLLRTASMQGSMRVGQLSRQVIEAARRAEAINRAAQQRMLSQRLVKLYALACSRTDAPAAALLMKESIQRIDDNLAALEAGLVPVEGSQQLVAARDGWAAMRKSLAAPASASELPRLDAQADAVLAQAEALLGVLEASGMAPQVLVINQSGRQRMLSQRYAKFVLLGLDAPLKELAAEFERGLAALRQAPLSTPEIRKALERGELAWRELKAAAPGAMQPAGRRRVAAVSEELFEIFDKLTEAYQHSIQVLMGG